MKYLLPLSLGRQMMTKRIETPTVGEILKEEFMDPYGISAYKLAQDIKIPTSRIQDILHGRRKITVDTSLRLAKYFDVSDRYFLDIQDDIDIRNAKLELRVEIDSQLDRLEKKINELKGVDE